MIRESQSANYNPIAFSIVAWAKNKPYKHNSIIREKIVKA